MKPNKPNKDDECSQNLVNVTHKLSDPLSPSLCMKTKIQNSWMNSWSWKFCTTFAPKPSVVRPCHLRSSEANRYLITRLVVVIKDYSVFSWKTTLHIWPPFARFNNQAACSRSHINSQIEQKPHFCCLCIVPVSHGMFKGMSPVFLLHILESTWHVACELWPNCS